MRLSEYINFPKNYRSIDSKVSGGSQLVSPFQIYKLRNEGFTDVIDLRKESSIKKNIEKIACKLFKINYTNIKLSFNDSSGTSMEAYKKVGGILEKNQKTYIHCKHGKHRTGLCLAAYEKTSTPHNDKDIMKRLDEYWEARGRLTNIYDSFIAKFNIKIYVKRHMA